MPLEDLVVVRSGRLNQLLWSTVYEVAAFDER